MPITYRIDRERSRIVTTCAGDVTLPEVTPRLNVLLDLTRQTSVPMAPQIQAAADRVGLVTNVVFEACAIVVSREAMFGMARMFEVLARGHFAVLRTFRDRQESEEWLDGF